MKITIGLVLVIIVAYFVGAKFPQMAQKTGLI